MSGHVGLWRWEWESGEGGCDHTEVVGLPTTSFLGQTKEDPKGLLFTQL